VPSGDQVGPSLPVDLAQIRAASVHEPDLRGSLCISPREDNRIAVGRNLGRDQDAKFTGQLGDDTAPQVQFINLEDIILRVRAVDHAGAIGGNGRVPVSDGSIRQLAKAGSIRVDQADLVPRHLAGVHDPARRAVSGENARGGRARREVSRRRGGAGRGLRAQSLDGQRWRRVGWQVAGQDQEQGEGQEGDSSHDSKVTQDIILRYKRLGWSVSRILSDRGGRFTPPERGFIPAPCLGDHLSRRRVAAPLQRPTRDWLPPSRRGT